MKKLILLSTLAFLILSGCNLSTKPTKNSKQPTYDLSKAIPIVLIHGSGGDEHSFDSLTDDFMNRPNASNESLAVLIDAENNLHYQGKLTSQAKRPLISIGYAENNAPIEDWSAGLKKLMEDLKKNYHFTQIDAVGYSNGGLALTYYAETIKQAKNVPSLRKIVLLAAPFNDLDPQDNAGDADFKQLPTETAEFQKYQALKQNLAADLTVLSIAGDDGTDDETDGIVPLRSALASRLLFPEYVHTYIEKQATKGDATHINLVNNSQALDWIYQFLVNDSPSSNKILN